MKETMSIVQNVTEKIYALLVINMLFIIGSIPIATIGASACASFSCVDKLLKGDSFNPFKEYIKSYKLNFKLCIKVWLSMVLLMGMSALVMFTSYPIPSMLKIIQIPVFTQLLLIVMYVFLIISKFEVDFKQSIKVALVFGNKSILVAIGSGFAMYLLLKLGLRVPAVLIFLFFSGSFTLITFFVRHNIKTMEERVVSQ